MLFKTFSYVRVLRTSARHFLQQAFIVYGKQISRPPPQRMPKRFKRGTWLQPPVQRTGTFTRWTGYEIDPPNANVPLGYVVQDLDSSTHPALNACPISCRLYAARPANTT